MIALQLQTPKREDFLPIPVTETVTIVGRTAPSTLCLPEYHSLSRQHAAFQIVDGSISVRDLNSKNGTFVNEKRITESVIGVGDLVRIGNLEFQLVDLPGASRGLTETRIFMPSELLKHDSLDRTMSLESDDAFRLLYRVSTELIQLKHSAEFMDLAVSLVQSVMRADSASLFLADKTGSLKYVSGMNKENGKSIDHAGSGVSSQTMLQKVVHERVAVMVNDTSSDPAFKDADSIVFSGIKSFLAAPLLVDDRLLGVVAIDLRSSTGMFGQSHLELLTAVANLLAVGLEQNNLIEEIERENRIRQRLAQFHSPAVVDEIVRRGGGLVPKQLFVTAWFCDIHGFSTYAEVNKPEKVEKLINDFFEMGVKSVFKFEGTLDKYLGDGFLAVFGAPFNRKDDPIRGVKAAVELHNKLDNYNKNISKADRIAVRSGINTGNVIAGDIGASIRKDYTVIGDVVNVAQRFQQYVAGQGDIILGKTTADHVQAEIPVQNLGRVSIRGREGKQEVYSVIRQHT